MVLRRVQLAATCAKSARPIVRVCVALWFAGAKWVQYLAVHDIRSTYKAHVSEMLWFTSERTPSV